MEEESELMNKKNINKYNQEEEPKIHGMPKSQLEKIVEKIWEIIQIIEHYIHAIMSVLAAGFTIYYTNIFYNLFCNPVVDTTSFIYMCIFMSLFIGIVLYLSFYLPFKTKNDEEYEKKFNEMIPYCTIFSILFILSVINCIWPLYRWYSFLIVIAISWGFIMSANFAPSGIKGNIFIILLIIAAASSGKFINHVGHTY